MDKKKCLDCGKEFTPKKGIQKYCSKNCRSSAKFKRTYKKVPGYYPKCPNKTIKLKRGRVLTDKKEIRQRQYKKEWNKKNSERLKLERKEYYDNLRFGQNRNNILEYYNWECQHCGMNNEQHIVIFGKSLNIHHINNDRKNNNIDNLLVLCLRCHCKIHRSNKNE